MDRPFDFDGAKLTEARGELTFDQLAAKVRRFAEANGGYTREAAEKSFSASWLSKCEKGGTVPRYGAVALIARALGKPVTFFERGP